MFCSCTQHHGAYQQPCRYFPWSKRSAAYPPRECEHHAFLAARTKPNRTGLASFSASVSNLSLQGKHPLPRMKTCTVQHFNLVQHVLSFSAVLMNALIPLIPT